MIAMKRDLDLILHVLRTVEKYRKPEGNMIVMPDIPGYEPEYVREHVKLCGEAGLLDLGLQGAIRRITWNGHDYLDANRDKTLSFPQ